jgi:hypothetical protein
MRGCGEQRRRPRPAVLVAGPVLGALAVGATACSAPASETSAAEETAMAAVRAAAARDTNTLCGLLAASTVSKLEHEESAPCAQAAGSLDLGQPTGGGAAQVWGRSALVPIGSTTVFLTDVNGRWRVLAAGCALREQQPAECVLGGS